MIKMVYDPNKKRSLSRSLKETRKILNFVCSFEGQSQIAVDIILEIIGSKKDLMSINDIQYEFYKYMYGMDQ
jgi:hypothetical protein